MRNLAHAARPLVNDLLSSAVFAVLVAVKTPPMVAAGVAIGFGVAHVLWMLSRRITVAPLQWASLALVLLFGTASLFLHDVRFLMAKPTVIYLIIATVMMKRGWMLRYLPPVAVGHGEGAMIVFGYVWAALMVVTAGANLVVAFAFTAQWPLFMAIFPVASKVALFAVQFVSIRAVVRPRIMAQMQAAQA